MRGAGLTGRYSVLEGTWMTSGSSAWLSGLRVPLSGRHNPPGLFCLVWGGFWAGEAFVPTLPGWYGGASRLALMRPVPSVVT